MLDIGLGVRLIAVAAASAPPVPAPPGKPPFPLSSSSSLRHRCSCWWLSNGNAHGRDTTTTTSSRATRRWWWSDRGGSQEDYGSSSLDDYDYEGEAAFSRFGWAEEIFDESWFSKVFKLYGSVLPVMLVSMFAATGLKAFLMAMAIPLGQSAISFLRRRREGNRDDWWMLFFKKNSRWRRPFQEEEYSSSYYERRRRRHSYQSWVSKDFADAAGAASTAVGADDNIKNSSNGRYGGWDELLDDDDNNNNAAVQEARKRSSNSHSQLATLITARNRGLRRLGRKMRMPRTKRRWIPRTTGLDSARYKQAPLLMTRLLVAVFPFLGSWFRLL